MSLYEDAIQSMLNKNNHLDLDLPNFTASKYNKCCWKFLHFFIFYVWNMIFAFGNLFIEEIGKIFY